MEDDQNGGELEDWKAAEPPHRKMVGAEAQCKGKHHRPITRPLLLSIWIEALQRAAKPRYSSLRAPDDSPASAAYVPMSSPPEPIFLDWASPSPTWTD